MKNFAGAGARLVENYPMVKRAGFGLIALLALCFPAFGQQAASIGNFDPIFGFYRPELFAASDYSNLVRDLPIHEFLDGRLPGSTALGRMGTAPVANFPVALVSAEPRQKRNSVSGPVKDPKDGKDYSSAESFAMEKASLSWTGGEIGFFYGHGSGRFSGDEFGSYITGGVGNEHLQINVGAGYEESHFSRSRR
jgi:hypothetical protein